MPGAPAPAPRDSSGAGGGSADRAPTGIGGHDGTPTVTHDPTATTVPGEKTTATIPSSDDTNPDTTPGVTTPTTAPVAPTPLPVGHVPVANNDYLTGLLNTNYTIDVLANDTDADGNLDPSTLSISGTPGSGLKATVVQGKIQVDIDASIATTTGLVYEVCDTTNMCAKGVVTITMLLAVLPK
jgi:hypothetical protein